MQFLEEILKWWPILVVFGQVIALWVAWSIRQAAKNEIAAAAAELKKVDDELDLRVDAHGARLDKVEGKVVELEKDILDLPTRADIAKLGQQVKAVDDKVATSAAGIQRLEGYFLQRGVESAR